MVSVKLTDSKQHHSQLPIDSLSRISNLPNKKNGFQLISNKKALVLYATDDGEREKWKDAIKLVIEENIEKEEAMTEKPRDGMYFFTVNGNRFEMDKKYELIKQVGCGAYGTVVSVRDKNDQARYAVKKVSCQLIQNATRNSAF